ncbi:MAG: acyl-CoA dehydrogenase [Deltaproteobacteria bacterium]|nr:acyl-CoA dehydrogenase [Deltaproteobacteria bacterium]
MDIRFTPAEERFRAEARAWIEANKPTDLPDSRDLAVRRDFDVAWQRKLHDAGWAGISWPKEYGGRGATLIEQLIWFEEFARADAPEPATLFVGLNHGGPTLIACGTDEQKAEHLPRILRGDTVWCQGFSEPNAGSDLAGLQTRAVFDGDDLVVTGQKIWTSFANIAEWQELLVRTDPEAPKHKGITWVICPMDAKGIEIRPIRTMSGHDEFCEVFYDEVRIPRRNVVGRINDGWRVAMSTLSFERGTAFLAHQVRLCRMVEDLASLARVTPLATGAALDDVEIARRIARLRAEVEALRSMTYRSVSKTARTGVPSAEASIIRLFFSELQQRVAALATEILGVDLLDLDPAGSRGRSDADPVRGEWAWRFLAAFSSTIAAGSKDIQRNIIGERVLGLPR